LSRLQLDVQLPDKYDKGRISGIIRALCSQVNGLSEGQIAARYYTNTVMPAVTLMPAAQGDIVWKSNPSEGGTTSEAYVVVGWICTASGSPGTWEEMRVLTKSMLPLDLDSDVSGVLPVENGGTEVSSLTANGVLFGNGTAAVQVTAAGSPNKFLRGTTTAPTFGAAVLASSDFSAQGTTTTVLHGNASGAPSWGAVGLTTDVSGILPLANGGTSASLTPSVGGVFVSTTTAGSISAALTYLAGELNNLSGGVSLAGAVKISGTQVLTARQTGWSTPSGTLARTAYSTYASTTVATTYDDIGNLFTTVQALANHMAIVSQRLGALITDVNTHGAIGP
jgi:hypothetical protein